MNKRVWGVKQFLIGAILGLGFIILIFSMFFVFTPGFQDEKDTAKVISDKKKPLGNGWWNTNWLYRKDIIIDDTYVNGNQVNFPILFTNTSSDFSSHAQSDGDDFAFVDTTNT